MAGSSILFDEDTREMVRVLCYEYDCSTAHLVRQLVRAEFRSVFPGARPAKMPSRPQDKDRTRGKKRPVSGMLPPEVPSRATPKAE
jgi:hypothetical protein